LKANLKKGQVLWQKPKLKINFIKTQTEKHFCLLYIKNCITEASKQFKIVGKGKSTYSKLVASTVEIEPFMIELEAGKYEVFRISAVNPMTKGRMMTERPKYNKWKAEFEIVLNDPAVPVSVINEILEHAGKYVGVGDWRPEKKGMFGKFIIIQFKTEK